MYIQGVDLSTRASTLVRQLIDEHDPKYGVGSMTCSAYDTAFVSMVAKARHGRKQWLFPSSFHFLLDHQQHDGGWYNSTCIVDGILNTLAALLALCKHIANPYQLDGITLEVLNHRKNRALYYLETKFSEWDPSISASTGFETLIPKLLQLLEQEGVDFVFPGKEILSNLKKKNATKYKLSVVYSSNRTLTTQSLEGMIGELDFDRVSQHKISGSMMASPASTAAYLMYCSSWDDEAEEYLSHIVSIGNGKSTGGVPSRYPTTVSEATRVVCLLLQNGFQAQELGSERLESVAGFLEDCLQLDSGVTGFAPYVESDADNTARAISTLCLLGKPVSPQGMIVRYETREHFKTYTQDRNPNFRTNCLVLKALLDLLPSNSEQMPQIETTVRFITNFWWTANGQIEDSSNLSPNYPIMLMVDAFARLVHLWPQGLVPALDDLLLRERVFISLFQALTRTLQTQNQDGSWGNGQRCETTAYALLNLTRLASFSSAPRIKIKISQAIEKARGYLCKEFRPLSEPDHLWTGKTTSGSGLLFQAYVLAALQAPISKHQTSFSIESRFEVPLAKITIQSNFYSGQPWFANITEWQIQACLVECHLFLPQLRDIRYAVFPSDKLAEDEYFELIPFTWIAASSVGERFIGAEFLYQLMIISFLNRQFENYTQNVIGGNFANCLFEIQDLVHNIFEELEMYSQKDQCFCDSHSTDEPANLTSAAASLSIVRSVLYRFISHILNHPYVLMASHHDQDQLRSELLAFILGRIDLSADSKDTPEQRTENAGDQLPRRTLQADKSTDRTYHPYCLAFLSCLVGNQMPGGGIGLRRDFLDSPEQQYLAADLCRHVSIISFLTSTALNEPDSQMDAQPSPLRPRTSSFGSAQCSYDKSISSASTASSLYASDTLSPVSPVSSVSSAPSRSPTSESFRKSTFQWSRRTSVQAVPQSLQLARLLGHERRSMNTCLASLEDSGINERTANMLKLFVDAADLSDQVYVKPRLGSYYPTTASEKVLEQQACILNPPPVPSKKTAQRDSMTAARASLRNIPPDTTRSTCVQSFAEGDALPLTPGEQSIMFRGTTRTQHELHRNKHQSEPPRSQLATPNRRASRSPISVSRIERIMSDIDGHSAPLSPPKHGPRSTSDNDVRPHHSKSMFDAHKRISSVPTTDAEAVKLAKLRLQTEHRKFSETQRRKDADAHAKATEEARKRANHLQSKAMAEAAEHAERTTYGGWIKSPPPDKDTAEDEKLRRAGKLYKINWWGGPKWKAPF